MMPKDHWTHWNSEIHLDEEETLISGSRSNKKTSVIMRPVGLMRLKVRDGTPVM